MGTWAKKNTHLIWGIELDGRDNIKGSTEGPDACYTSLPVSSPPVTCAAVSLLVVWAIREGHQYARAVDEWLMGRSDLSM